MKWGRDRHDKGQRNGMEKGEVRSLIRREETGSEKGLVDWDKEETEISLKKGRHQSQEGEILE